ncbi:MAG: branched-chain amino acid transaminase [Fulvivirga sp.]|nr:branched-chain amino acid transaminase [Fulvivirga sp.]
MYYNNESTVFLDGQWLRPKDSKESLFTQSIHYGNAVFEGMRAYKSGNGVNIFKAREHFDRLHYSAEKMHLKIPYTTDQLVSIAYQLVERNEIDDAYIRPLVYPGENMALLPDNESHLFMACWKWANYLGEKPLNVIVSSYQRPNPKSCHIEAKVSGHYANSLLAAAEAKKRGYDEALLLDVEGYVAEGSVANFFYEKDEVLYTPSLGHILPGITRATIIELAKALNIPVVEKKVTLDEVLEADSAFLVGTAAEVAQVGTLNGVKFPQKWTESTGYHLYLMFRQQVKFNEYQGLTIV